MTSRQEPAERANGTAGVEGNDDSLFTTLEHGIEEIRTQPPEVLLVDVVRFELPYILMLAMAVLGIGIIILTGQPTLLYGRS